MDFRVGQKVKLRKYHDCLYAKEGATARIVNVPDPAYGEFLVVSWLGNSGQQDGSYFRHRFKVVCEEQLLFSFMDESLTDV